MREEGEERVIVIEYILGKIFDEIRRLDNE